MHTTRRHINNRVRLAAVFVFCLAAAHLSAQDPRFGGRIEVRRESAAKALLSTLAKKGAAFPVGYYLLKQFSANVLLREAPMVVEYRLGERSTATVTLTVRVKNKDEAFMQRLEPTGGEIREHRFRLPASFGKEPVVGTFAVRSANLDPSDTNEPDFELYGSCMGEKACGSIGVYNVNFQPVEQTVRVPSGQRIGYAFESRHDFENVNAYFEQVGPGGKPVLVRVKTIKGVRRGQQKVDQWDGKTQKGKVSKGRHKLVVKASYSVKKGGDWADAPSRNNVFIE